MRATLLSQDNLNSVRAWDWTPLVPKRKGGSLYGQVRQMTSLLPFLLLLSVNSCCIRTVTSVHNLTGREVSLAVVRDGGNEETLPLSPDASVLIDDFAGGRPTALVVTDRAFRYTFHDNSLVQGLPRRYVSSSRFTSDFPCKRITRWIALLPKDELWAARFGDPTDAQPLPFPLLPAKIESMK
jgi:hypothetical protein